MFKSALSIMVAICVPALFAADYGDGDNAGETSPRTFTLSVTTGLASTFQMPLGGSFGSGPAFMDTMTASLNNAFRTGDAVSVFGWNSTDLPSSIPDWQGGLRYQTPLLRRGRHSLDLNYGIQRWCLPNVATGAKDWLTAGGL